MSHRHPHHHGPLEAITHVAGGPMVLDIGGSVGALHVRLDESWVGRELFLATDDPGFSVHTGVWVRHAAGRHVVSALFPALEAGTYHVVGDAVGARFGQPDRLTSAEDADQSDVFASVNVDGGQLTEIDLSEVSAAAPAGTAR